MVIVDSDVWITYLRRPNARAGRELASLLEKREATMVGVVMAEVLQGARSPQEFGELLRLLEQLPYLEAGKAAWVRAGELSRQLRGQGRPIPLTDLLIAALALEHGCAVYTLDEHFRRIPGVALHKGGG